MTFGEGFAGIGGMGLGLERAGMRCAWQIEIDGFARKALNRHWPHTEKHGDIKTITGLAYVDLFAAGFPCQDISIGGEQAGIFGERSGLFFEAMRLVRLVRPRFVLLENVSALLDIGMGDVVGELATSGYDCEWDCLPAVAFGAPHQRDRVFILAYSERERLPRPVFASRLRGIERQTSAEFGDRIIACGDTWRANSASLRMGDGVPLRVARRHVKAYGNAVSPAVSEWIGRRIMAADAALRGAA